MSILLDLGDLSKTQREYLCKACSHKPPASTFDPNPKMIYTYSVDKQENTISIPIGLWRDFFDDFPYTKDMFSSIQAKFKKQFQLFSEDTDPTGKRRDQDAVAAEALYKLDTDHTCFIAAFTGFGKTMMGSYLLTKLGLKAIVLCHASAVREQWPDEINKFCDNIHVQYVKTKLDPNADVYIMGIKQAMNYTKEDFAEIGTVIIDEAHICTKSTFTRCMFMFHPRYLIGLSATPDRTGDGLELLMKPYFGGFDNFIFRKEIKKFVVIKVQTNFQPEIKYITIRGRPSLNWNVFSSSLELNPERQKFIVDTLENPKFSPELKTLVLCHLQDHTRGIYDLLLNQTSSDSVEILYGTKKKKHVNINAHYLVAGKQKAGTGYNDPKLQRLALTFSTKDVRQFEGRVRTVNNLIIDFVDFHSVCESHWKIREKWYRSKGATIEVVEDRNCDPPKLTNRPKMRRFI